MTVILQVAAGLMAGCLPAGSCAARIMLFAGGPPTVGSGKVVDMELLEPIRQATVVIGHTANTWLATSHAYIFTIVYVCDLVMPLFMSCMNMTTEPCACTGLIRIL